MKSDKVFPHDGQPFWLTAYFIHPANWPVDFRQPVDFRNFECVRYIVQWDCRVSSGIPTTIPNEFDF